MTFYTIPLAVVTFKWKSHGYRSSFGPETVNTFYSMVDRHYPDPHENICITDDPTGIDRSRIKIIPLWPEWSGVANPWGKGHPSCYRRMKVFAEDAKEWLAPRFVCVDLDAVICGDMRRVWNRREEFVIWGDTNPMSAYNGSMFMMDAGARKQVYETFNPQESPMRAKRAGRFGSDQGWISHVLGPGESRWSKKDGVYSWRLHIKPPPFSGKLPSDASIVFFHGAEDPWHSQIKKLPWIQEHYK